MHLAPPSRLAVRGSRWLVLVAFWSLAVVLSTLQIYFREIARGLPAPWSEVLLANALAWLPWLAIAPAVIAIERRFPIPSATTVRYLAVHLGWASLISTGFLIYLGYFHAAYLEGGGLLPSWASFRAELTEKLGQHFLVAVMLYVAIALGSFAYRSWSARHSARDSVKPPPPLIVRSVGEVERIEPAAVDWIEACGNYARLHLADRTVLIRRTLGSLDDELKAVGFVRVHRSALVNTQRVAKLHTGSHGDAEVELTDGHRVKVSRTYRRTLEERAL